ncbi:MAG TPA: hypothetical protein VI756_30340, partial [Blastocatellia bacterium]
MGIEMTRALQRHAAGQGRVVPVILRSCLWQGMPFGRLQALPRDGKPIKTWNDEDEAFNDVASRLREIVLEVMRPVAGPPPDVGLDTPSLVMPVIEPTPIRILHLSDLHFSRDIDPAIALQPLVADIRDTKGGLGYEQLDY